MVVRHQQQQQPEEGTQTDSVLHNIRNDDITLTGVFPDTQHPQPFQENIQTCVFLEDTVPMVALECELALSGRLSPPANPTAMPLPLLSDLAGSNGAEKDDPLPFMDDGSEALSFSVEAGDDRLGRKRKLPQSQDDGVLHEDDQCTAMMDTDEVFQGAVIIPCERCGENRAEERGSKRRRRSHECYDIMKVEEDQELKCLDDTLEQPDRVLVDISHMDLSVEQTLDVITTSNNNTEHGSVVEKTPSNTEVNVAPLMRDVIDSMGTTFVQDLPCKETLDNVLGVDSVVDGESLKVSAPSDPAHLTSKSSSQHHQQQHQSQQSLSDSFGAGGDSFAEDANRDATFLVEAVCSPPRPQRISPFLNTPKQRKEERRKVLKLCIHKMRAVDDPEHFLRRSVLINNTMKRLQRELREEKMRSSPRKSCYTGLYRRSPPFHYYDDALNHNNTHHSYVLSDESFGGLGDPDRITDDMTDALVTRLEAATSSPSSLTSSTHHLAVVPTPSPSPSPLESEPAAFLKDFSLCSDDDSSCSLSSSTVATTVATTGFASSSSLGDCNFSDTVFSSACDVTESMSGASLAAEMMTTSPPSLSPFGADMAASCTSHMSDDLMLSPMDSAATTALDVESVSSSVVCELTSSVSEMTSSADDVTLSTPELPSVNCISSSSSFSSSSSSSSSSALLCGGGTYDNSNSFSVPSMVRDCPSPSTSSCSSESQREKQLFTDIDVVFNNLIHALGDS